jgi:hypothetical protein
MLEVCADFIADADTDAGLNGIDPNDLCSACLMCDDHGRDVKNLNFPREAARRRAQPLVYFTRRSAGAVHG